ncbi:predicted protein [Naegleria gruberi]|uniref:Predicted protein n=1 Tax=Naegleria gruberi TaxID=5762 RepID=D2VXJ5_NAEGR|nr:uncharacterized protein NAEGRDRAFT_53043 [Naegleria gruberi]EFC38519.1 predicted protein [Naegleria gruberi]|eukprot:XP_002671263.1 predicted protein [Naegleria gruberi strain NEG-M]
MKVAVEGSSSLRVSEQAVQDQTVNNRIKQWSSYGSSENNYQAIEELIKKSKEMYSEEMRVDFSSQLARESIKRKALDTTLLVGSWYTGDMSVYTAKSGGGGGCETKTYPFIQMKSTGSSITVSVVGVSLLTIDSVVQRPFSTLYNGVLTYQKDSAPVCFDLKNGALSLSTDFLLCSSVNEKPTCSSVLDAVTITYNSPGTITSASIAGVVIVIVLVIVFCIACCVCCCCCMAEEEEEETEWLWVQ